MSTVDITITPPTTGSAVDYYNIIQTTDNASTITKTSKLVNRMTIPPGKTTFFTAEAVNEGGKGLASQISVVAPAVVTAGANDFFMTNPSYAALAQGRGLSGGSGVVSMPWPANGLYRIRLKFKASLPTAADERSLIFGNANQEFMCFVQNNGMLAYATASGTTYTNVQVCDGQEHILEFQNSPDSRGSSNSWVDGANGKFSGPITPSTKAGFVVSALGGTNPNGFVSSSPGIGTISELALFSDTPYANFQASIPVNTGLLTGTEANLLRLWHFNNNGTAAFPVS